LLDKVDISRVASAQEDEEARTMGWISIAVRGFLRTVAEVMYGG
jgi:hypothetical protein